MERSKGCQELSCYLVVCCVWNRSVPLVGCSVLPFIDKGEQGLQMGERRKTQRVEKVLRRSRVFLSSHACPADMADRVRDGVFVDPYMVVPWPHSTSGYVPSYTGGRCGVLGSRAVTLQGVDGEVTIRLSL